ncbi:MAG TPA: DUF4388 domain-containing protein [Thermoanaerobaculia bacterium]|nr:DUF4388 domain-containing protein [Thermoanaerobaculia bacterium]
MSLSGHLRTMAAGHLFQWLSFGQKSGRLVVTSALVEKTIYVQKGRIVSSASTDPREYLGQFLMSHGFISEDELKKAMEVQQQSRILLGKILVIIEAISEDDLRRLMKRKAEEEIYDIFLWPDGEFEFEDDDSPAMEMVPLSLDVTGIVMEGSRRVDEWSRIREVVPSLSLVPVASEKIDTTGLSEAQRKIIELIDGQRTGEAIALESRASNFVVSRTLYELATAQRIELEERDTAPAEEEVPEEKETETFLSSDAEVASLLSRAQAGLRDGEYDKSLRLLKAAQNLDPEDGKVRASLKGAESVILGELRKEGISDHLVPHLTRSMDDLSSMNFSPNEGFILSRINGQWDIGSIAKISPMREIDAMLIFHKLLRETIIEFR